MDNIFNEFRGAEQTLPLLTIIAEQVNEGVVVVDLNGIARFVNTAMAKMHGYLSSKDLIGKKISVFHSENQMKTDVFPMIEEVKHRGQLWGPIEHLRNDGIVFPTQTKITLLKDGEDKAVGFVIFVTDMTERIEMERSLIKRNFELDTANEQHQINEQAAELTKLKQQLQEQIAERENAEQQLRQHSELSSQHAAELTSANQQLQQQISEHKRSEETLVKRASELTVSNERLQQDIDQRQQTLEQFGQYRNQLEQQLEQQRAQLTKANEQLGQRGTECELAEQKMSEYRDQLERRASELAAVNERLEQQITEHRQVEDQLQHQVTKLEQAEHQFNEKASELAAIKEQLQKQTSERESAEHKLQKYREQLEQHNIELTATQERLGQQIAERQQLEQHLEPRSNELKTTEEEILKWITCYISFPADVNIADVNSTTILLNGKIKAEWTWVEKGKQVMMAKFSRSAVQAILQVGQNKLTVSGKLNNGALFEGKDTITVINEGKGK